jgi:hypothetical protein
MTQEFYINSGSILPVLRIELINDGRCDFNKSDVIGKALQDAKITFSMRNVDTEILKISNAKCNIVLADNTGCEEKYVIEYKWKERDTKEAGIFQGWFTIDFNGNITENEIDYPEGRLIVPISEDLIIYIK